jgi:hypothetical protein
MKCRCERCSGSGEITCTECDGSGEVEGGGIEKITLRPEMTGYKELVALQADAARVRSEAKRLTELCPDRAGSYQAQLAGTLEAINRQAEKAAKPPTTGSGGCGRLVVVAGR